MPASEMIAALSTLAHAALQRIRLPRRAARTRWSGSDAPDRARRKTAFQAAGKPTLPSRVVLIGAGDLAREQCDAAPIPSSDNSAARFNALKIDLRVDR